MTIAKDAINTIYSYIKRKTALDTERPQRVLDVLNATGNPQNNLKTIHVTGTKGKGSTCAMLAAALQANGYRVGLYTSPHLHDLRERIQINGSVIPADDLVHWVNTLKPHFDRVDGIGFPEVMTCLALQYFAAAAVDIAIIEVHLGGRYDATNVITPLCSVITTIDYDHTDILGDTLAEIAYHKAGIIKPNVPIVSAPQQDEALAVIQTEAQRANPPLSVVHANIHPPTRESQTIDVTGQVYSTNLPGMHQGINLAVAVTTLHQLNWALDDPKTREGLKNVQWGGRFEIIQHNPPLILDIAHNVAAATVLRGTLDALYPDMERVVIYGSKANKDVAGILSALLRKSDHLILTQADDPPTAPPQELAHIAQEVGIQNITQAANVDVALRQAQTKLICVTGSIFIVAEARAMLR